jgi:hypothetical protein
MSQFEVADLFVSYLAITITIFVAFVSTTSAILVAAYFTKGSIPNKLAWVVIVIYSTSSIFLIGAFQRTSEVLVALRVQMQEIALWHTAVAEAAWVLPTLTTIATVTMLVIAIGAIWYFQYSRSSKDT